MPGQGCLPHLQMQMQLCSRLLLHTLSCPRLAGWQVTSPTLGTPPQGHRVSRQVGTHWGSKQLSMLINLFLEEFGTEGHLPPSRGEPGKRMGTAEWAESAWASNQI